MGTNWVSTNYHIWKESSVELGENLSLCWVSARSLPYVASGYKEQHDGIKQK